jgi:hypothetical protein
MPVPALGGDDEPVIGVERIAHRLRRRAGAIEIGGIEQPHSEAACLAQQHDRIGPHRAKSALDGDVEGAHADARHVGPANGNHVARPSLPDCVSWGTERSW